MRDRAAREGAVQFRGRDIALALVQQLDVAAQGDRGQAILGAIGVLADARQQRFAEADAEAQHLEAEFLGDPVMPELMDGNQDADRNQEGGEEQPKSSCKGSSAKLNQGIRQASRCGVGVQNITQSVDGGRIEPLQYFVNDR